MGQETSANPLEKPVNEKAYAKSNVVLSEADRLSDIPEAPFVAPPVFGAGNTNGTKAGSGSGPKSNPTQPQGAKPLNDIPDEEKSAMALKAARTILDGYGFMCQLANDNLLHFDRKRLKKMEAKGEIYLNTQVQISPNQYISVEEFIAEFNRQASDTLVVSDEFKKTVTPVLKRVLQKRGVGMTDEQELIYLFGKDIATKLTLFISVKATMNEMIAQLKDLTTEQRKANSGQTQTFGGNATQSASTDTGNPGTQENAAPQETLTDFEEQAQQVNQNTEVIEVEAEHIYSESETGNNVAESLLDENAGITLLDPNGPEHLGPNEMVAAMQMQPKPGSKRGRKG